MLPGISPWIRFCALCGMVAPVLFGLTVGILGYLTAGYDPVTQVMSELGATGAPYAAAMNLIGLAVTGLLMILFSLGLREGLGKGPAVTGGSLLVAAAGISYLAMAAFSCDPGCVPVTPPGQIHLAVGMFTTTLAIASAFVLAYALRGKAGWEGYWQYSLLTGLALIGVLPPVILAQDAAGLWQRVFVGIIFLWQEIIAIRLYLLWRPVPAGSPGTGTP